MLQTFTFGGAGRIINAQARYFRYESGSANGADESIRVRAGGQDLGEYYPGDSIRLPADAVVWEIAPNNAACAGRVRLGVGNVESSRLVGRVEVVDASRLVAIADQSFLATANVTPNAGKFAQVQIWNATSNKGIELRGLYLNQNPATPGVGVYSCNAKFTGLAIDVQSRRISSVGQNIVGVQTVREPNGTSSTIPFGGAGTLYANVSTSATQQVRVSTDATPFVIAPGYGLALLAASADQGFGAVFDGRVFDWV